MGDSVRYLLSPANFTAHQLRRHGAGRRDRRFVPVFAVVTRKFRIEWFATVRDFVNHAVGGVLMGIGGVLSMGCTIGQGVTGISTLAMGSILTFPQSCSAARSP